MGDVTVVAEIAAPAEAIYDLVADMPRMGEWSPECERVEWIGGVTAAAVGVGFRGHNRNGRRSWSTHGTVTVADRGREFTFEVRSLLNLPVSQWSYRFDPGRASAGSQRAPRIDAAGSSGRWDASPPGSRTAGRATGRR